MKNLFTAILIAVVSTSVFAAEYYVYDYKASIKRLDYVLTTKKVSKVDTVIQKYMVEYSAFSVNGKSYLPEPVTVWHNAPRIVEIPVKAGDVLKIKEAPGGGFAVSLIAK